jgi:hypothetical protein
MDYAACRRSRAAGEPLIDGQGGARLQLPSVQVDLPGLFDAYHGEGKRSAGSGLGQARQIRGDHVSQPGVSPHGLRIVQQDDG